MSEINDTPDRGRGRSVDDSEPVTAARRVQNLGSIRQQDGWQDFPDCLPRGMRTTKGGKLTDFGNTKLRIIERIALNARLPVALAYFNHLTQDGARILRLKDLETCADHFEANRNSSPSEDVSNHQKSSEKSNVDFSSRMESHRRERSLQAVRSDLRTQPDGHGSPAQPRVRFREELAENLRDPTANQRAKRQRTSSPSSSVHQHPSRVATGNGESTMNRAQEPPSNTASNPVSAIPSQPLPHENDILAGYTLPVINSGSDAIFAPMHRAFDDLLSQVRDYNRLFSVLMDQHRDMELVAANPNPFADLEHELTVAKDAESRARTDYDQANSALNALKAQYGGVDSSLSRALLATVGNELEKAQEAVQAAFSEVERVESKLSQARVQYQSLDTRREELSTSMTQLQGQTRFWLKRLGEIGVELTSQPGAMQ